jgi:hypothetical protein
MGRIDISFQSRLTIISRSLLLALFGGLTCLSLLALLFPVLAVVWLPGILTALIYSVLTTHIGPTGWGHAEVLMMCFGSALIYLVTGTVLAFRARQR